MHMGRMKTPHVVQTDSSDVGTNQYTRAALAYFDWSGLDVQKLSN